MEKGRLFVWGLAMECRERGIHRVFSSTERLVLIGSLKRWLFVFEM